jgi:HPt (histidine-containing phosphotransfer) domain-containing protein
MSTYYDPKRVRDLEQAMGSEAGALAASTLAGMSQAIEQLEEAVLAGDLDRAIRAAHACRNDAMMVGARQLLEALTAVEAAGRDYDEARTATALERVRDVWPPTRDELAAGPNPP